MSSLDLELDAHMNNLELEWRQAYESSIVARADYQSLAASPKANADLLITRANASTAPRH